MDGVGVLLFSLVAVLTAVFIVATWPRGNGNDGCTM